MGIASYTSKRKTGSLEPDNFNSQDYDFRHFLGGFSFFYPSWFLFSSIRSEHIDLVYFGDRAIFYTLIAVTGDTVT